MSTEKPKTDAVTNLLATDLGQKHTLIITEKPDAAKRIAKALDKKGKPESLREKGIPYFIIQRDKKIVVAPTIGHLYTITHKSGKRNHYPVFNFKWIPRHLAERNAKGISNWIETFVKLSRDADEFISACDYDLEGSLIGYFVLKYACGNKASVAKRMKFSTLVKDELEKAYETSLPRLDFALIEAGKTRHEVDWLYGINLSRALTLATQRWSGKYSTLSTGRVQGPTLQFLSSRENRICSFVPTPYWQIVAEAEAKNSVVDAEYERKRIQTSKEADTIVEECKNTSGEIKKVDSRVICQKPPVPFDIGTLQREAYGCFGYIPRRTLAIAQRLYLGALISYPRTSSQKLPATIGYKKILGYLKKSIKYKRLATKLLAKETLIPREGSKTDSAHPAIYPTGKLPGKSLSSAERRVWDLIVKRFMAVFSEDALKESQKVILDVNGYTFSLRAKRIISQGWMEYYKPYVQVNELKLPTLKKGDRIRLRKVVRKNKFTLPPPRYNPSSLLKKMEEFGIGTKATRAEIIQTLYDRGYIRDERIMVTELGLDITDILARHASSVTSVQLTQELEAKMHKIQDNEMKREEVLEEAVEGLKSQLESFKENERSIGEILSKATKKVQMQKRVVGKCPNCGTGNLMIIYSRKTKKRFIGCSNYFRGVCTKSFPLPQRGTVKAARKNCKTCGWPRVFVWLGGKRPLSLCLNPNCNTNIKWSKKM